jgi:hypothetical protein
MNGVMTGMEPAFVLNGLGNANGSTTPEPDFKLLAGLSLALLFTGRIGIRCRRAMNSYAEAPQRGAWTRRCFKGTRQGYVTDRDDRPEAYRTGYTSLSCPICWRVGLPS